MLLAVLESPPRAVLAIDPSARKVLWRRSIDGSVIDARPSPDGLVVLAAPADGIGPARILSIGVDGSVRAVVLDRVSAGFRRDQGSEDFVGERRSPGLAIDPVGNRAYVVGAGEPIAQVALASMRVSYHGGSRTLAKAVSGPWRVATWLGNGMLAVAGTDSSVHTDLQGRVQQTMTPSGLLLIDTNTWVARMLERNVSTAIAVGDSLLAYGSSYDSATRTQAGSGLTIYGLDGTRRLHLFGHTSVSYVQAEAGLAYVRLPDRDGHVVVVDPAARRILASVTRPRIALLARS
jgi:hypothetical protein